MNHLGLITKREFLNKVKNKSFILMTFLSPLIMVGVITLVVYLTQLNNDNVRTISVLDESKLIPRPAPANKAPMPKTNFLLRISIQSYF